MSAKLIANDFNPFLVVPSQTVSHIGQAAYEGQKKATEYVNVIDLQREMTKKLPQLLEDIIQSHSEYADEYYIILENQRFRHIPNAIRQYLIVRRSKPQPCYDQTLWSYNNKSGTLLYHWTLPDRESLETLYDKRASISKDQEQLLSFVIAFKEGKLT